MSGEESKSGGRDLQPFQFEGNAVRIIRQDDEPWWVLSDICKALEIENQGSASSRLDDDEKGLRLMDTPGGLQNVTIINESGLYSLVMTSRKKSAKRFKKWITSEVLPTIRKTGSYTVAGTTQVPQLTSTQEWAMGASIKLLTDKMDQIEADAAREVKEEQEKRDQAERALEKERAQNCPLREQNEEFKDQNTVLTGRLVKSINEFKDLRKKERAAREWALYWKEAARAIHEAHINKQRQASGMLRSNSEAIGDRFFQEHNQDAPQRGLDFKGNQEQ